MTSNDNPVDPIDVQIGGDADPGGLAQPITAEDVQAILMSPEPVERRLDTLKQMRGEIEARASADRGGEFGSLLAEIDDAIAELSQASGRQEI